MNTLYPDCPNSPSGRHAATYEGRRIVLTEAGHGSTCRYCRVKIRRAHLQSGTWYGQEQPKRTAEPSTE